LEQGEVLKQGINTLIFMNLNKHFQGASLPHDKMRAVCGFILLIALICPVSSMAQMAGMDEAIQKNRKGVLIVKATPGAKVGIQQLRHEFWFGSAISSGFAGKWWSEETKNEFKQKFLENFNCAVTENAVKWPSMEPRQGMVNYSEVDAILTWTEANHIPLRAHNLFWGIPQFVQPWVKNLNNDELRSTMQNRAESLTRKYKGRFAEYDLNNEMVHGNYYEERLGADITKQMAQWAHTGDPEAKLFLNDYDILTGIKLADYTKQIQKLLDQGVPIAGIGAQGHLHGETFDRQQLKNALDALAVFHLPVRVTEFNMPGQRSKYCENAKLRMPPEQEERNAKEFVDFYKICFAHPAVDGILLWGFWEDANWIPASSLYRHDWSITPTGKAYRNLVFNEWWTREDVVADKNGNVSVSAFYGKYKITVNGVSRELDLTKQKGSLTVDFSK
jgi:GH35 family endo-1,4-beta-xylanase